MRLSAFRFEFLASCLVFAAVARTTWAADEKERETEEKAGMNFDLGKMFEGLKGSLKMPDGDLNKFGDLFGDLSHLKNLFGKEGGDGEGADVLKDLDLSKLFDGLKEKKDGLKDKEKKKDMLGECDGPGTACRADGVPLCRCASNSFCASSETEGTGNGNTCVLGAGQNCTKAAEQECASGRCSRKTKGSPEGECSLGSKGSPCSDPSDCITFSSPKLACNSTTGTCDECGPGRSCNATGALEGCCEPYRCEKGRVFEEGGRRRLSTCVGEVEKGELGELKTRCCADTLGPPCGGSNSNCCNPKDRCVRTGTKLVEQSLCCRDFGESCQTPDECCPTKSKDNGGPKLDFGGSSCINNRCCINVGSICGLPINKADCCGHENPGTAQINCLKINSGKEPVCGSCIQNGKACVKNTDCCGFLVDGTDGKVCRDSTADNPGFCDDCGVLNTTCRITAGLDPSLNDECCNNPYNSKQRLGCDSVKIDGISTDETVCCVDKKGVCESTEDCCQPKLLDPKVRECRDKGNGFHCFTVKESGDRRRLSSSGGRGGGAGPVGVEASSVSSGLGNIPLNAQNRTNPHSSAVKRDAMKQAKEKREKKRKRGPTKAPWLDHYFGFSLGFSEDCSLLAVGEPGTDEQQGAVSVYRLRTATPPESSSSPFPFTFASPPVRRVVTRTDPPLSGSRLQWTADPTKDRVTLKTRRLAFVESKTQSPTANDKGEGQTTPSSLAEAEEVPPKRQLLAERVTVDLAPPRRRFPPRSRDRGGKALFGSAVAQCSAHLKNGSRDEYVHFLAVSAPGSWHGNVYVYVLTEGDAGFGSLTGSVGDDRVGGFGYEIVQELVSQGGTGPFEFLQRLSLRDAGGFGEARMGQTVQFERREESGDIVLLTTEQREGAQPYGFKMNTQEGDGERGVPVWPPFQRLQASELEEISARGSGNAVTAF